MSIPIVKHLWQKNLRVINDFIFGIPISICLFTIQLSWGYNTQKEWFTNEHRHWSGFLAEKIWLHHVTCKQGITNNTIFGILDTDLPIHYTAIVGLQ